MMKQLDKGDIRIFSAKYIGKTMCGFINGNIYAIKITRDLYGYNVEELSEELTDRNAMIRYASATSIDRNWELLSESDD